MAQTQMTTMATRAVGRAVQATADILGMDTLRVVETQVMEEEEATAIRENTAAATMAIARVTTRVGDPPRIDSVTLHTDPTPDMDTMDTLVGMDTTMDTTRKRSAVL